MENLKKEAKETIDKYAKAAATAAGLLPFGIDFFSSAIISSKMLIDIAKVYDKKLDSNTINLVREEILKTFFGVLFASGVTLVAYKATTIGFKTNPVTYIVGMVIDGVFTYFLASSVGYAFGYYCSNNLSWGNKSLEQVLIEYIKEVIYELFINKIPEKFRDKIIEMINPDLLK